MSDNAYFNLSGEDVAPAQSWVHEIIALALKGELTHFMAESHVKRHGRLSERDNFCRRVAWFVPTVEWADSMARALKGKRVLEVCAGRSVVMKMMRARGIEWIATDRHPVDDDVIEADALKAVEFFTPDVIFAAWIPWQDTLDIQLARLGKPLILQGEGFYGCTGSEAFWDADDIRVYPMTDVDPAFRDVPRWYGMHDYTYLVLPEGQVPNLNNLNNKEKDA